MRYKKPSQNIDFVENNIARLNEGVVELKKILQSLPYYQIIRTSIKPQLDKENFNELKISCSYGIVLGNNDSKWRISQTWRDPNPALFPQDKVCELGDKLVEIAFIITYNFKRRCSSFKIETIWDNEFKNARQLYKDKFFIPDDNNVVKVLSNAFGYNASAKSRASVKHKSTDFDWFRRTLEKIIEAIDKDSVGLAQQAVNIAQTGAALSTLK